MEDRKSDTEETYGEQATPSEPSDQNAEQSSYPPSGEHGEAPDDGDQPGSATSGAGGSEKQSSGRTGGAGEHSQATGNPLNAG